MHYQRMNHVVKSQSDSLVSRKALHVNDNNSPIVISCFSIQTSCDVRNSGISLADAV